MQWLTCDEMARAQGIEPGFHVVPADMSLSIFAGMVGNAWECNTMTRILLRAFVALGFLDAADVPSEDFADGSTDDLDLSSL